MKTICRLTLILFLCLSFIQCNSDDDSARGSLLVNGNEFKLGTNSASHSLNIIKFENDHYISLEILEKTNSEQRSLGISLGHENNSATATYELKSNMTALGIANVALYDVANDTQIAGGAENQPTGTITVTDLGNHTFKIAFNNVVLDPGTVAETTITGSCTKTFVQAN